MTSISSPVGEPKQIPLAALMQDASIGAEATKKAKHPRIGYNDDAKVEQGLTFQAEAAEAPDLATDLTDEDSQLYEEIRHDRHIYIPKTETPQQEVIRRQDRLDSYVPPEPAKKAKKKHGPDTIGGNGQGSDPIDSAPAIVVAATNDLAATMDLPIDGRNERQCRAPLVAPPASQNSKA